ncbi:zinc-binding dehydrogenase [Priestia aryabhattai]|uniref:zinc-binding dehydrogenase n=1 Tax=Priestia aryabhattai TaxID=412384 RepID=UPI00203E2220|nr:zinc-binding dehydrogenase [Priestia aryabhattai]MCM3771528.1 zinc-binding dehydrogenase [Priestia aryabhattai]
MVAIKKEVEKGKKAPAGFMKAVVYEGHKQVGLQYKEIPKAEAGEVVIKTTSTTICGTDIHILHDEHKVEKNRTLGHEHVGVVHEVGEGVTGIKVGARVMCGSCTPCGSCYYCQKNLSSQCIGPEGDFKTPGGWRLGNTIDGTHAEYFKMPFPQYNLTKIPDELSDEDVLLLTDIASTGIAAAENAQIQIGDIVAVFACGPVGLCAIAGARLKGASFIIGIDGNSQRLDLAKKMGADITLNFNEVNVVEEIMNLSGNKGIEVAIEALGKEETFQQCLKVIRRGGCISSVGVYSGHVEIPIEHFASGMGDHRIVTTLCPGGRERMQQLMSLVIQQRMDLKPMITHRFTIDEAIEAYRLFEHAEDQIIKPIITF